MVLFMKNNLPITDQETPLSENAQLVTATDLKGKITYCNQEFIDISGFTSDELIGSSHNIVRHPDMPTAAFKDLWSTLKQQKPWLGLVKNRSKNGNYYWVEAYVTPVLENDKIVGYESVRVKPKQASIDRAVKSYALLNSANKRIFPSLDIQSKFVILMSLLGAGLSIFSYLYLTVNLTVVVSVGLVWTLLALGGSRLILSNILEAVIDSKCIVNNKVTQKILTGFNDEGGQFLLANLMQKAKLRTVLGRVDALIDGVTSIAFETDIAAKNIALQLDNQHKDITKLATAMEQMSASVAEVASSATSVSESAKEANDDASLGKQAVLDAAKSTHSVADEVYNATKTIVQLEKDSESIDAVLVVIRGIAEQTNLLALNAAIEAARAGEQGRGFAVVADEVRTLASRTQNSTEEIQRMIEKLQENSRSAVKIMESSSLRVEQSVTKTENVGERLDEIFNRVKTLNQMNISIAEATEEQRIVSSEISSNVYSMSSASDQLSDSANSTSQASEKMAQLSKNLRDVVVRFKG